MAKTRCFHSETKSDLLSVTLGTSLREVWWQNEDEWTGQQRVERQSTLILLELKWERLWYYDRYGISSEGIILCECVVNRCGTALEGLIHSQWMGERIPSTDFKPFERIPSTDSKPFERIPSTDSKPFERIPSTDSKPFRGFSVPKHTKDGRVFFFS